MKKIDGIKKGTSIDDISLLLQTELGMNFGAKTPIVKFQEKVDNLAVGLSGKVLKELIDDPNQPSLEEQAELASFNAYLEAFHDGKWIKHWGTFDSIEWNDGYDPPDESDSLPHRKEYYDKYIHNARELLKETVRQYPPIEKQLDMIYWDKVNGTNIWVDTITKIKKDNPIVIEI